MFNDHTVTFKIHQNSTKFHNSALYIYLSTALLTRILAHKDRRTSCNPSKGADGRLITTTAQLLSGWEKFLGAKFQRPTADADRNLENLVA